MVEKKALRILAIFNGDYGLRHLGNIVKNAPDSWRIQEWKAPNVFPPVIDYPEDYLPEDLPPSDLILSFAEHRGVAELLPDIANMTQAKSVIAPIDNEAWLPRGLARQLRGWLERLSVACATPKPLCSLTETDYMVTRRKRIEYEDELISEFARYFGQPELKVEVDKNKQKIISVEIKRDAVCGCARFVAEGLVGVEVEKAEEVAGLLHHHFPCLASMGIDVDFDDTLMHVSGNILKDDIKAQIKPFIPNLYIRPGKLSED